MCARTKCIVWMSALGALGARVSAFSSENDASDREQYISYEQKLLFISNDRNCLRDQCGHTIIHAKRCHFLECEPFAVIQTA
jgi:hypothetical protein